jgi:hypothetical protein
MKESSDDDLGSAMARARARREARTGPDGALYYEQDDPRCRLTAEQARALPMVAAGKSTETIATSVGVVPERVKRWRQTPRFRKALRAEEQEPTSPRLAMQVGFLGPVEASKRIRAALQEPQTRKELNGE